MNSSKLLVAVVVLQALTLAGVWSGNGASQLPAANAQSVDPGAQRLQMVEAQRETNAKLDQMIGLLKGELQVRVVSPDEAKDAPAKGK
jgi:TolA-binding protein